MGYPRVSIIILNWNGWKDTIECLESIYKITYPNYDVIVVDNGSKDDSVQKIKEYCEGKIKVESKFFNYSLDNKPIKVFEISEEDAKIGKFNMPLYKKYNLNRKLILIKNKNNYGFAGGNNIGMKFALYVLKSDYILLINNDTVVDKNFLIELVKVAESDEKIGVVGPKVYLYSKPNIIQTAGVEIRKSLLDKIGFCIADVDKYKMIGYMETDNGQFDYIKKVDSLVGCCILIKRRVIDEFGYMDEKFFLYHEESDWLRCISKKYLIYYTYLSRIWHKFSASSGDIFSPNTVYYMARNSILFARKHNTYYKFILFLIYLFIYKHIIKCFEYTFHIKKIALVKYYYIGIINGLLLT